LLNASPSGGFYDHSFIRSVSAGAPPSRRPFRAVRKADPKNILGSGQLHPALGRKIEQLIDKASAQVLSCTFRRFTGAPRRRKNFIRQHAREPVSLSIITAWQRMSCFEMGQAGPSWMKKPRLENSLGNWV
jgi:hypothetical protein